MGLKPKLSARSEPADEMTEAEYYVLGGGGVGEAIAKRLRAEGYGAAVVDESYESSEIPGRRGDPADVRALKDAGLSDASTVVVSTRSDKRNLLIAQLVNVHFGVSRILALVNGPERHDLVAEAGHEPVCAATALSDALVDNL